MLGEELAKAIALVNKLMEVLGGLDSQSWHNPIGQIISEAYDRSITTYELLEQQEVTSFSGQHSVDVFLEVEDNPYT